MLNNDVLRLKIAVNDTQAMHKGHSFEHFTQNTHHLLLTQLRLLADGSQQLSVRTVFHYQIDVAAIVEKSIKFDDIGVLKVHLYLYLPCEGNLKVLLLDHSLRDSFYCTNKTTSTMSE